MKRCNNGGTLAARHVFGEHKALLLTIKGSDKDYAITDPQGSVVALSDSSRTLSNQATYSPWGESSTISSTASFGYTGQRYDGETGLYFYKARYYSPQLGRFLSHDPIGYRDNLNMYAYVNNDPLNYVDPTGMKADQVAGMAKEAWDVTSDIRDDLARNAEQNIGAEAERPLFFVSGQDLK